MVSINDVKPELQHDHKNLKISSIDLGEGHFYFSIFMHVHFHACVEMLQFFFFFFVVLNNLYINII